jgi:hypothetical protein
MVQLEDDSRLTAIFIQALVTDQKLDALTAQLNEAMMSKLD